MPRKKAPANEIPVNAAIPPSPLPAAPILCPACKSKISADGKTLHEKSDYLDMLVETDAGVDEVEKNIGTLEKKLAAANDKIAELERIRAADTAAQLAPTKHGVDLVKKKESPDVVREKQTDGKPKSKSWWD
jgi:hypothetical protein